jgi:hypothetical protein
MLQLQAQVEAAIDGLQHVDGHSHGFRTDPVAGQYYDFHAFSLI